MSEFTESGLREALESLWSQVAVEPEDIFMSDEWFEQVAFVEKWNVSLFTPGGLKILFPALRKH